MAIILRQYSNTYNIKGQNGSNHFLMKLYLQYILLQYNKGNWIRDISWHKDALENDANVQFASICWALWVLNALKKFDP